MADARSTNRAARLLRAACISTPDSGIFSCRRCAAIARVGATTVVALAIFCGGSLASGWSAAGGMAPVAAAGDRGIAAKPAAKAAIANPGWKELSPSQQQTLSPLATEWDKLDAPHKSKWLEITRRYVTMKPDDQNRMQERMRAWVALTPEQRRVARESYARTKKLNTDQKSAQWEQYQQLPEDQKKKLAAEAAKNKVAALPPVQSKPKTVAPIKSASKPILQQSVLPKPVVGTMAGGHSGPAPGPAAVPAAPLPAPAYPVAPPAAALPAATPAQPAEH